jgi:hypothetical protein
MAYSAFGIYRFNKQLTHAAAARTESNRCQPFSGLPADAVNWLKNRRNAGVMENGLVKSEPRRDCARGPLSRMLSNLVLDELERELNRRAHRFVRYTDCSLRGRLQHLRSQRAGGAAGDGERYAIHHRGSSSSN